MQELGVVTWWAMRWKRNTKGLFGTNLGGVLKILTQTNYILSKGVFQADEMSVRSSKCDKISSIQDSLGFVIASNEVCLTTMRKCNFCAALETLQQLCIGYRPCASQFRGFYHLNALFLNL